MREIIVDNFAGGGGASTGIEMALGRSVDVAINHEEHALAMHRINHPETKHYQEDIFQVDPRKVCRGRPVGLAHFSPDCKHFSRAAGKRPRDKNIRGLAWVVVNWANKVNPRVITLENVDEFQSWGPLSPKGKVYGHRKGWYFDCFAGALRRRGYRVEFETLTACDYGAPTIRKRLFMVARCDGRKVVWPEISHGLDGLPPFRTAAECIDPTIPVPSIFERNRELVDKTKIRLARGVMRYVVNSKDPYLLSSFITECANGSGQRNFSINEPLRTQCAQVKGGHFALVSAFLTRHFGQSVGQPMQAPAPTVMANGQGKTQLVAAYLSKLRGTNIGSSMTDPLHTVSDGGTYHALVAAFMTKYYGSGAGGQSLNEPFHTVTSKDRFNLVTVQIDGETWALRDIGMRMLQPHELYKAQGFPDNYIIDRGQYEDGVIRPFTKTLQVRMCGNSVSPPVQEALTRANVPELIGEGNLWGAKQIA